VARAPLPYPIEGLAATAAPRGLVLIFGGFAAGQPWNAVGAYSPALNRWFRMAPMPTGRELLGAALSPNGRIYVIGGWDGTQTLTANEAYDPISNTWAIGKAMPAPREGAAVVAASDGRIYVFGGFTGSIFQQGFAVNTVEAYDPVTDTWTQKSPMPTARWGLAAVQGPDGKIYTFGGSRVPGCDGSRVVEIYDPALDRWSTGISMKVARTQFGAAMGSDGRAYAIGGIHVKNGVCIWLSSVESSRLVSGGWQVGPSLPIARNLLAAASAADGTIYAIGGDENGGTAPDNDAFHP
jgi:N-acetylneuraminic acid mutarotase